MIKKPPILKDADFRAWCSGQQCDIREGCEQKYKVFCEAEAQRDADAAYYEPLIERLERREMNETFRKLNETDEKLTEVKAKLVDTEFAIQQAKAEVARGIFEEIEKNKGHHLWYPSQAPWDKDFTIFKEEKWYQSLKSKYTGGKG